MHLSVLPIQRMVYMWQCDYPLMTGEEFVKNWGWPTFVQLRTGMPHLSRFSKGGHHGPRHPRTSITCSSLICRQLRSQTDPGQGQLWDASLQSGHIWQRRFYDFVLFSEKKRIEKLRYMHRNPFKRGRVLNREH
jgi:hypothetical protein